MRYCYSDHPYACPLPLQCIVCKNGKTQDHSFFLVALHHSIFFTARSWWYPTGSPSPGVLNKGMVGIISIFWPFSSYFLEVINIKKWYNRGTYLQARFVK